MRYRLLFFLIFYLSYGFCQTNEIDSLKRLLDNTSKADIEQYLEILHVFGDALIESSLDSTIQIGKEGLDLAENHQLVEQQNLFHGLLASCYGRKGSFYEAIEHFEKQVDFYEATGKEDELIGTYIKIGDYYTRFDPEKSMPLFNKALEALKNKDNPQLLGSLHQSMGIAFYYRHNYHQASTHLEQAIKANLQIDDWGDLCSNNNILGLIRQEENKHDQAEEHFLKALELAEVHQFNYSKIGILANLGRFFSAAKGLPEKGAEYLKPAYEAALQAGYIHRAANILTSLSGTYVELGDNQKAIATLMESLTLQEETDDTQMKMTTLEQISHLYSEEGDYKNAYDIFIKFKTLQDSLINEQNLHNIEELEKKYKTQEQQSQIQIQNTQLQQQRSRLMAISLFSLLLAALVFFIWRSNQHKKRINAQLRKLDTAKSRFFANISHELRTPLTLILAPLEDAIETVKSKSVKENLQLAHSNSKKLFSLVNEIMDLSKLESGKMQLKETAVDLEMLLRRIFFSYQSLAQVRGFDLSFAYHLPKDLGVQLDIEKFEKVLNNLLSNAFKYSNPGGTIALDVSDDEGNLKIEIQDTGKGISKDNLESIFDRFYQIEGEGVPLQGGTGIGLAYAKEIAQLFGGDLRVESELDKGSNFILTMPLKKAVLKKVITTDSEEIAKSVHSKTEMPLFSFQNGKPHLLIVEDNPEMSNFLVQTLSNQFLCTTAMDGVEALNKLENQKFDLITSDVMMPNMDGFTFLEKVHEREDFLTTPVIMLTARTLEEDKLRGFQLGVDDYLTKPFSTKELIARINNLLRNKAEREQWHLENSTQDSIEKEEEKPLSFEKTLLKTAEDLVLKNISNSNFKVTELARELNYSQRQVARIVKKLTGLSPVGFVREIRLQKAYQMIESRQFATISEVRFEVGIEDASHFTKKFQERFGRRPNEV